MLRVMLFDEAPDRSMYLRLMLERLGYEVVAEVDDARRLHDEVARLAPDAVIIDTESPSRDTLEHLCLISEDCPRPIVMFTQDGDSALIREAVRVGVTAYIVDGLAPERVRPIIDTAIARFEAFQQMKQDLTETRMRLSERKLIERAKGILMREKNLGEDAAYRMLRKFAMDKNTTLAKVCEQIIAVSSLLA